MAITKQQKNSLVASYVSDLKNAKNVVLVKQSGISVNDTSDLRMALSDVGWKFNVVRKRLFLLSLADAGMESVSHEALDGAVVALYATDDEYAPMKEVQKFIKASKRADKKLSIEYVGGWFDKEWKDGEYVSTLANLPSKEELVGKLLFLLQHPVQKLVGTLDAIAKKDWSVVSVETTAEVAGEPASNEVAQADEATNEEKTEETPETKEESAAE